MAGISPFLELLRKNTPPLFHLIEFSHAFAIRLNEQGTVLDIAAMGEFHFFRRSALQGRNIRELYFLPAGRPVASLAAPLEKTLTLKGASYLSRNQFEFADVINQFFTLLPFSTLVLRRAKGVGLIGIIVIRRLPEFAALFGALPFVLIDARGVLYGLNRAFLDRFPHLGKDPAPFLDKPADRFLNPNPAQWIAPQPPALPADTEWKEVLSAHEKSGLEKYLDAPSFRTRGSGCRWFPAEGARGLLPLALSVDTTRQDFRFELDLVLEKGNLPGVIVNGDPWQGDVFPDYYGYFLGPAVGRKTVAIKKEGEFIHESRAPRPFPPGRYAVRIVKQGALFSYFINGRLMLCYRDPNPIEKTNGIFHLYHRGKGRIRLAALRLFTRERPLPGQEAANETVFLNADKSPFQFYQVYNRFLTFPMDRLLYGFLFVSITRLKETLSSLKDIQARTAGERDRYKMMALTAGASESVFLGDSAAMARLRSQAEVAAKSPATILIEGETGSGKAVLARYIHEKSLFQDGPFVRVDCAALPEGLIESELFGHEKGAFTGADRARAGRFEEAEGGTLFLDEIGNLGLSVQAKLLNFLQDFTVERLGSSEKRRITTRIIAAVNRPLDRMVKEGRFREDLYFRLNTVRFPLPPLRERKEDIPLLCAAILNRFNERFGRSVHSLSASAYQKLMGYSWPGNIRELENVIQKAVLFCDREVMGPEHLELPAEPSGTTDTDAGPAIPAANSRALRREHVEALLRKNNGILRWAAREAQISEATLYRKVRKFGIERKRL